MTKTFIVLCKNREQGFITYRVAEGYKFKKDVTSDFKGNDFIVYKVYTVEEAHEAVASIAEGNSLILNGSRNEEAEQVLTESFAHDFPLENEKNTEKKEVVEMVEIKLVNETLKGEVVKELGPNVYVKVGNDVLKFHEDQVTFNEEVTIARSIGKELQALGLNPVLEGVDGNYAIFTVETASNGASHEVSELIDVYGNENKCKVTVHLWDYVEYGSLDMNLEYLLVWQLEDDTFETEVVKTLVNERGAIDYDSEDIKSGKSYKTVKGMLNNVKRTLSSNSGMNVRSAHCLD